KVLALSPPSLVALASALKRLSRDDNRAVDAAVALLRRAQEKYPGDFWINHDLAFGLADMKPPRWGEAIPYYRIALALRLSAGVSVNLGNALAGSGDRLGAIAAYRQAIAHKPDYVMAYNNLGRALGESGDLPGAIAAFRQAITRQPGYAPAHYNLGVALEKSGDRQRVVSGEREAHTRHAGDA